MKSIDAIYKFGHLYDRVSKKRILIEDGAQASLVLDEGSQLQEDVSIAKKEHEPPLASEQKLAEVWAKYGRDVPFWKIGNTGQCFFFKISGYVPKRLGKEEFLLEFKLELLEDLYIYNKQRKRPEMAMLYPCKCKISDCLTDNFEFFEPVHGDSLNKARTKLHELYFSRVVNPSSNAFEVFYLDRSYHKGLSLGVLRLQAQKQRALNDPEEL